MFRILWMLGGIIGLALIGLAVFAFQLGIDHDPNWGMSRILLAVFGGLAILSALLLRFQRQVKAGWNRVADSSAVKRLHRTVQALRASAVSRWWNEKIIQPIGRLPIVRDLRQSHTLAARTAAGILFVLSLAGYVWLFSAGRMNLLAPQLETTTHYSQLADAFLHGQVYLLEEPSQEILAITNPYDPQQREGVSHPLDVSLYNGHYYLYWGPVPALLLMPWQAVGLPPISDSMLVFLFVSGLLGFSTLLLLRIRKNFFPSIGAGGTAAAVLAAAFAAPVSILLRRPYIYEASTAGAQFFLIGGLVWFLIYFEKKQTARAYLVLSGIFWSLAVGCRATSAAAVILWTLLGVLRILRKNGVWRSRASLLALGLPLAGGAGGMLAYNWMRFDSIFETGFHYQLTVVDTVTFSSNVYSLRYLIPNIYNYFLRLPQFSAQFPFLHADWILEGDWPFFIHLPPFYNYTEPVIGLLFSAPFLLMSLAALRSVFSRQELPSDSPDPGRLLHWFRACLLAAALIELIMTLSFFYSTQRYLMDIVPTLVMLAAIGLWQIQTRSRHSFGLRAAALLLAGWTVVANILLSIGYLGYFEKLNPQLLAQLTQWFTR